MLASLLFKCRITTRTSHNTNTTFSYHSQCQCTKIPAPQTTDI